MSIKLLENRVTSLEKKVCNCCKVLPTTDGIPTEAPTNGQILKFDPSTGILYYYDSDTSTWEIGFAAVEDEAPIKMIEVNLSSAQILGMFTSPVLAIPGEVGKVALIHDVVTSFTYGGIAYAGGANIIMTQGGISVASTLMNFAFLQGSVDKVMKNAGLSTAAAVTLTPGADTVITGTAQNTLGNGTLKVSITYQMVSI